jgi:hypothetical protein
VKSRRFTNLTLVLQLQSLLANRYSPIYDSGCCLGREVTDKKVSQLIKDKQAIEAYVNKGSSEVHWEGDNKKINHYELLKRLLPEYKDTIVETINKCVGFYNEPFISEIVNKIDTNLPEELMAYKLPYEGFPDVNKVYSENVLRIFGQRIMRTDRHDIDDFFDFWQINKKFRDDPLYMLAYTQGMLPTDNYEFLASFNPVKDLSFVSEISGLSRNEIAPGTVKVGDLLTVIKEPLNKQDDKAVKLFKGDIDLGYVKTVHSRVFYKAPNLKVTVRKVEQNGKINRIFIKVATPQ